MLVRCHAAEAGHADMGGDAGKTRDAAEAGGAEKTEVC